MLEQQLADGSVEEITFAGRRFRVIDLSQTLSNTTGPAEVMPHQIEYVDHATSAESFSKRWNVDPEIWRNRAAWSFETITLTTHSGTHIDAPYHYTATDVRGEPARTIDHVPFAWLMTDGVRLDMRHVDRVTGIGDADVRKELDKIGYAIKKNDAVLIWTGTPDHYAEIGYDQRHPGLRAEATRYLLEQGARLIGIDAWGIDRPMELMLADAVAGDRGQLWESHYLGAEIEYSQIEKLANLDRLPAPFGFTIIALPVKIERGSAGWARVVALVPLD